MGEVSDLGPSWLFVLIRNMVKLSIPPYLIPVSYVRYCFEALYICYLSHLNRQNLTKVKGAFLLTVLVFLGG
jgi:hypothetical protein